MGKKRAEVNSKWTIHRILGGSRRLYQYAHEDLFSGMSLRLAFSICTAFPSDIVIMDEWLASAIPNSANGGTKGCRIHQQVVGARPGFPFAKQVRQDLQPRNPD